MIIVDKRKLLLIPVGLLALVIVLYVILISIIILPLIISSFAEDFQFKPLNETKVTKVATIPKEYGDVSHSLIFLDPNLTRVGYVMYKGEKAIAVIDGVVGRPYDYIDWLFIFSSDGKHVAYEARDGEQEVVVLDGKEIRKHDGVMYFTFSPDSQRIAYAMKAGEKKFVTVDDSEHKQYEGVGQIVFSPDSKNVAYGATGSHWDDLFVVVNGKEGKVYKSRNPYIRPVFSPDSKLVAYVINEGEYGNMKGFLVVGEKEGRKYDSIASDPVFSPDGRRIAFHARNKGKYYLVVTDTSLREYEETELTYDDLNSEVYFSPDGKIYFAASRKPKNVLSPIVPDRIEYYVVIDGKESRSFNSLALPVFSPDGKKAVYEMFSLRGSFIEIGKKRSRYYGPTYFYPQFSPDGKKLNFVVMEGRDIWIMEAYTN
ncbi:MAG: PD40 domain-containing protein [Candidatus Aenigmarchaeota archaeon]|nr:PD40 domain-containing protein [Candidatus Aenigmarchaeota archaeon]